MNLKKEKKENIHRTKSIAVILNWTYVVLFKNDSIESFKHILDALKWKEYTHFESLEALRKKTVLQK